MITPLIYVKLLTPITLSMRLCEGPRARFSTPESAADTPAVRDAWDMEFTEFPLDVRPNCYARNLVAYLGPIPSPLPIYGPEDYGLACNDTMEEHAERVLEILGDDPAATLQALIDGEELPPMPPRIPREVAHWRMEYVLGKMNKLPRLYEVIADLPEEQREIAHAAWFGLAAINIKSPFIRLAAPLLGFSPQQTADLFIACAAIPA